MEDSGGRYGIGLGSFGVYQMPAESHEYGIENSMQRGLGCPAGGQVRAGPACRRPRRLDRRRRRGSGRPVRLRLLPRGRAGRVVHLAGVRPDEIDKVDFVRPDGTPQKMTVGDYRQLSDALWLPRAVTDVTDGRSGAVEVYAKRGAGKAPSTEVTVTSESDPAATATTTCRVSTG